MICDKCISDLKYAYAFRQQCWSSEAFLRTTFHIDFECRLNSVEIENNEESLTEQFTELNNMESEKDLSDNDKQEISTVKHRKRKYYKYKKQKNNTSIVCDICGQMYANPTSLKVHVIDCHENTRRFPCELCSYRSNRKDGLEASSIM